MFSEIKNLNESKGKYFLYDSLDVAKMFPEKFCAAIFAIVWPNYNLANEKALDDVTLIQ